jgi:hypothetical protein
MRAWVFADWIFGTGFNGRHLFLLRYTGGLSFYFRQ